MHPHALRDNQWEKIKDFLPGREGRLGGTAIAARFDKLANTFLLASCSSA
jgi:hypothetical protein